MPCTRLVAAISSSAVSDLKSSRVLMAAIAGASIARNPGGGIPIQRGRFGIQRTILGQDRPAQRHRQAPAGVERNFSSLSSLTSSVRLSLSAGSVVGVAGMKESPAKARCRASIVVTAVAISLQQVLSVHREALCRRPSIDWIQTHNRRRALGVEDAHVKIEGGNGLAPERHGHGDRDGVLRLGTGLIGVVRTWRKRRT